jgi:penicillin-binding protein 1A
MGRDDAKRVGGLQGATSPARAFHDFMAVAVSRRPVEQFETDVPMPDWQLEPEEEMFPLPGDEGFQPLVDEYGNPIPPPDGTGTGENPMIRSDGTGPNQQWLDEVLGRSQQQPQPTQPRPDQQQPAPPRTPPKSEQPAPDPLQPRTPSTQ